MDKIQIGLAKIEDIDSWIELVRLVRDNFPGLETEELLIGYRDTVIKNINRQTAICAKFGDSVIGVLIFSIKNNELSCMAVHPNYRRLRIASKMIEIMLSILPPNKDVKVMTFRSGDEKGIAPRALYKKFGFVEGELCYHFNYPEQIFTLHRG